MPTGKTLEGTHARGAIVLIYYIDRMGPLYLMGQETKYLTEVHNKLRFSSKVGENIVDAYTYKGDISNEEDLVAAKEKFTNVTEELEKINQRFIKHITFADVENSKSKRGYISAKPRCVPEYNDNKFGFPKGGYEVKDASINDTVIRECEQETGLKLEITKLVEVPIKWSDYALFKYELSELEYTEADTIITHKNKQYENELHHVQFISIPHKGHKEFFINALSRKAYELIKDTIHQKKGGTKKSRNHTRRVNTNHVSHVHVSTIRNNDYWFEKVFSTRKMPRKTHN